MAGTIPLSLTQQFDNQTGTILDGGLLYFIQAGTVQTPQNAYRDQALALAHPNPLTLSGGRVPFLWFADGSIKVRLTNSAGVIQINEDNIPIIGSSGGGGGVDTTDANSIMSTGDVKWRPVSGTLDGWVRMNGRTMGNAVSGASERANADAQSLFEFLYAAFSDTLAPVSGGRSGNATTDFNAGKTITLPDMRRRGPFGLADMGNTSLGFTGVTFDAGDATTGGSKAGAPTATIGQTNLPNVNFTGSASLNISGFTAVQDAGANINDTINTSPSIVNRQISTSLPILTGAVTGSISVASGGSGTAVDKLSPLMLGTWFMRL